MTARVERGMERDPALQRAWELVFHYGWNATATRSQPRDGALV